MTHELLAWGTGRPPPTLSTLNKLLLLLLFCLQSTLPAIFPITGVFGNSESSKSNVGENTKGDSSNATRRGEKLSSKADRRKERHERFLKSKMFHCKSNIGENKGAFFWDYSVYSYSGIGITEHTEYQYFPKEQTL